VTIPSEDLAAGGIGIAGIVFWIYLLCWAGARSHDDDEEDQW
jgi:hypothetical protein